MIRRRTVKIVSRRWALRAAAVIVAVPLALLLAGAVYLWTLPGVGDAEARVRAILAAHRGALVAAPPPRRLGEAVVAIEDEHFYSNVAVNIADGAGRAALATLQRGGDPGGSTIGQQLAKMLYPHGGGLGWDPGRDRAGGEALARLLESEVLAMYLNAAYFGNGYWGEEAAARGYFGSSPRRLTWTQAAMLAGLLQAPSAYDPVRHPRLARSRRHLVVDQLVDNRYLSPARGRAVLAEPLGLRRYGRQESPASPAPQASARSQ